MPKPQIRHINYRDGSSQEDRKRACLFPDYVLVDEHSLADLVEATRKLAPEIAYYDHNNKAVGSWEGFMPAASELEAMIGQAQVDSKLSPYLALFVAFLRMFQYAQDDLNRFTQRHLDFYYEDVLQLEKRAPEADKVHVLFELARNIQRHRIEAGSLLDAGKDAEGKALRYALEQELVLTQTRVGRVMSVMVDENDAGKVYRAPFADSAEGQGKAFEDGNASWAAFGESQLDLEPEDRSMEPGELGFVIGTSMLWLREGPRTIVLSFTPKPPTLQNDDLPTESELSQAFKVHLSTEEGWWEAKYAISVSIDTQDDNDDNNDITYWHIEISLKPEDPAIVPLQNEVEAPDSALPLLKITLNHDAPHYMKKELEGINISDPKIYVRADEVRQLVLQNDDSALNPKKSFLPFGAIPTEGSSFYVGSEELFSKSYAHVNLHMQWDDLPFDFYSHYYYYATRRPNHAFKATAHYLNNSNWISKGSKKLFSPDNGKLNREIHTIELGEITFKDTTKLHEFSEFSPAMDRGFFKLSLSHRDFGHLEFPNCYASRAQAKEDLPEQPYTPKIKDFYLSYEATGALDFISFTYPEAASQNSTNQKRYGASSISFIQEKERYTAVRVLETAVFAQPYLIRNYVHTDFFYRTPFEFVKREFRFSNNWISILGEGAPILPSIAPGSLYIGLEKLQAPELLSLLIACVEGSGNMDQPTVDDDISWKYLSKKGWKPIEGLDVVRNETRGWQEAGLIQLQIPGDITNASTQVAGEYFWIKAELKQGVNAEGAARVLGIYAQAIDAGLQSAEENYIHLQEGLEGETITQMEPPPLAVKKLKQPLRSFGGMREESQERFYCRVSERLRHKQRAITAWDYDHIVLEAFPELYKAKCLRHSEVDEHFQPGDVTMVVIPFSRYKLAANPLQPKASPALLDRIESLLQGLTPNLFVDVHAVNPVYETLRLRADVGFHPGYDPGFYLNHLNERIKQFLSPWAYADGQEIVIGGRLYLSSLIKFIEMEPYVDFISHIKLFHNKAFPGIDDMIIWDENDPKLPDDLVVDPEEVDYVMASSPRSILVSAERHDLRLAEVCSNKSILQNT